MQRTYLCIDLKTFFASVECVERHLDPFSTNLVVADVERSKNSICLAITPKMKMLGIKNRCRICDIPPNIKYIAAKPRMSLYMKYCGDIYGTYLKYFSKDDIHVYSIDEVFIDITGYLSTYNRDPQNLAKMVIDDVYNTYGITATAGIGTNMYLAKIALDITAKHSASNMGYLDEEKYKNELWHHKPLTDFWQIGPGTERRLNKIRLFDMYDVAHADQKKLFKMFGINAEYLIDHAWGREPCTIADIKRYKPKSNSISNSQILFKDYTYYEARTVLKEMVELISLRLVKENKISNIIQLYVGYSKDLVGASGGARHLENYTSNYSELLKVFLNLYDETTNRNVGIRRLGVSLGNVITITDGNVIDGNNEQLSLFSNQEKLDKEKELELTINNLKDTMGKNIILRGTNFLEEATARERNKMIGGHNGE